MMNSNSSLYRHITPRVPSATRSRPSSGRPSFSPSTPLQTPASSSRNQQRRGSEDAVVMTATRTLRDEFAATTTTSFADDPAVCSSTSSSGGGRSPSLAKLDIARSALGALLREYGAWNKCPSDSLMVVCRVSGLDWNADRATISALQSEIETQHAVVEAQLMAQRQRINQMSLDSVERKRALLEDRLRYHALLPAEPEAPAVNQQQSLIKRYVRGEVSSYQLSRAATEILMRSPRSTSPPSVSPPAASPRPTSAGDRAAPKSMAAHLTNSAIAADRERLRLELLRLRRSIVDFSVAHLPHLARLKETRQWNTSTLAGQLDVCIETFTLMCDQRHHGDHQQNIPQSSHGGNPATAVVSHRDGVVSSFPHCRLTSDAFVLYGRRLGGSASRIFTTSMFRAIRKFHRLTRSPSPPPTSTPRQTASARQPPSASKSTVKTVVRQAEHDTSAARHSARKMHVSTRIATTATGSRSESSISADGGDDARDLLRSPTSQPRRPVSHQHSGFGLSCESFIAALFPDMPRKEVDAACAANAAAQRRLGGNMPVIPMSSAQHNATVAVSGLSPTVGGGSTIGSSAATTFRRWQDAWDPDDLTLVTTMFRCCDADGDGWIDAKDLLRLTTGFEPVAQQPGESSHHRAFVRVTSGSSSATRHDEEDLFGGGSHSASKWTDAELTRCLDMFEAQMAPYLPPDAREESHLAPNSESSLRSPVSVVVDPLSQVLIDYQTPQAFRGTVPSDHGDGGGSGPKSPSTSIATHKQQKKGPPPPAAPQPPVMPSLSPSSIHHPATARSHQLNFELFARMQQPAFDLQKKKEDAEQNQHLFFKDIRGAW